MNDDVRPGLIEDLSDRLDGSQIIISATRNDNLSGSPLQQFLDNKGAQEASASCHQNNLIVPKAHGRLLELVRLAVPGCELFRDNLLALADGLHTNSAKVRIHYNAHQLWKSVLNVLARRSPPSGSSSSRPQRP
jgi:hypothetical protein